MTQPTIRVTQLEYAPLNKAGDTMAGTLSMGSNRISNLGAPTVATDAVTKQYADAIAAGAVARVSCQAASISNIVGTYNNGTSGVGATLTNSGAQVAFTIDGYAASLNNRILLKDQTTGAQNGIYVVTNVGSGSTNWVLTRASDFDGSLTVVTGSFVYIVNGTINTDTSWILVDPSTIVIGTSALVFSEFFGPGHTSPGGLTTQVQFNNGGSFAGNSGLTYASNALTVGTTGIPGTINLGTVASLGTGGIAIRTNNVARLLIDNNGAWNLAGSVPGSAGQALVSNGASTPPTWQSVTPSAGGANTQVQFNNSGSFAGSSNLTWNGSTLAVTGAVSVTNGNLVVANGNLFVNGVQVVTNSGTWGINISGNAATATTATNATLAAKASTLAQFGGNGAAMTFNWTGQSGQPTWVWGSNDGINHYVWSPANFSVAFATNATNAGNVTNISSAVGGSYTWTGIQQFGSTQNTSFGAQAGTLTAYSTNNTGATMSFHRPGAYAINMGLDSDNIFRIGGWSSIIRVAFDVSGNMTIPGSGYAFDFFTTSDQRSKTNIRAIPLSRAIDFVMNVEGKLFDKDGKENIGFIAQHVVEQFPEIVNKNSDGYLSLNYPVITAIHQQVLKYLLTKMLENNV